MKVSFIFKKTISLFFILFLFSNLYAKEKLSVVQSIKYMNQKQSMNQRTLLNSNYGANEQTISISYAQNSGDGNVLVGYDLKVEEGTNNCSGIIGMIIIPQDITIDDIVVTGADVIENSASKISKFKWDDDGKYNAIAFSMKSKKNTKASISLVFDSRKIKNKSEIPIDVKFFADVSGGNYVGRVLQTLELGVAGIAISVSSAVKGDWGENPFKTSNQHFILKIEK